MQHPKTLRGSSVLTAHIISQCLLSSSFHLASIAFVFPFFLNQWMLSCKKHTANYNSCHFEAVRRSGQNANLWCYITYIILCMYTHTHFFFLNNNWSTEAFLEQRKGDWSSPVCRISKSRWSSSFQQGSRYHTDNLICKDSRKWWAMKLCEHWNIIC